MDEDKLPGQGGRESRGFFKGFVSGAIVVLVAAVIVTGAGKVLRSGMSGSVLDASVERKISLLAQMIRENYYENVDTDDLKEGLYAGLFDKLDAYSQYYTPEEYKELYETSVSGTYCGIGASLQKNEETQQVRVVVVYDESPAEKAGLREGDVVLRADEYQPVNMDLTEFVNHIRGEEGTTVHLEVYRESSGEMLEFDIPRQELVLPTVTGEMIKDHTGYIDVAEFTTATPEQFSKALDDLKNAGMESLIVDLRSNPGGMLDAVCEMADEILPAGLIVYTEDRAGNRKEFKSTDEKSLNIPLVVLVDGQSASASEIFAGAVKDRGAGTIVGTTTFGKGVVQTIRRLNDGSAFKLTTNRYFTPGGTCIQDIGIKPDVEIEFEFSGKEGEKYSYEKDNQIQKALEILKEKNN